MVGWEWSEVSVQEAWALLLEELMEELKVASVALASASVALTWAWAAPPWAWAALPWALVAAPVV